MYRRMTVKLDDGALEEGSLHDKAISGTDSPSLEWVREQLGTRITLAYRYTPIVTPVCLPAVYCDHLTPKEAADIYSGKLELRRAVGYVDMQGLMESLDQEGPPSWLV